MISNPSTHRRTLVAAGLLAAIPGLARAQAYPSRPVRLVVPFPPVLIRISVCA